MAARKDKKRQLCATKDVWFVFSVMVTSKLLRVWTWGDGGQFRSTHESKTLIKAAGAVTDPGQVMLDFHASFSAHGTSAGLPYDRAWSGRYQIGVLIHSKSSSKTAYPSSLPRRGGLDLFSCVREDLKGPNAWQRQIPKLWRTQDSHEIPGKRAKKESLVGQIAGRHGKRVWKISERLLDLNEGRWLRPSPFSCALYSGTGGRSVRERLNSLDALFYCVISFPAVQNHLWELTLGSQRRRITFGLLHHSGIIRWLHI